MNLNGTEGPVVAHTGTAVLADGQGYRVPGRSVALPADDLLGGAGWKLSPRLEWMRRHNVRTMDLGEERGDCSEGDPLRWLAWAGDGIRAVGETEEYALLNLALAQGWALWNEEGLY